jgi:hypothetical protein
MLFPGRRRYEKAVVSLPPAVVDGVRIGSWVSGGRADDVAAADWYWPRGDWTRHALVMGAPGSGKSETVLRMAYALAGELFRGLPVQVLYFDAKNDPDLPGRFGALMAAQGRRTHFFPEQRMDLWRGDWRAVRRRLMRVVPYAPEGSATWYRDIARVVMEYVCTGWDEPPRSSGELFARLLKLSVAKGEETHPLLTSVDEELVEQVLLRYRAFWGAPGLVFDGDRTFEDLDTGYFRIDADILGEDADYALCMLFLDFVHYCKVRKPRDQLVVLVLDEFSAIANAFEMDRLAEELRSFNVSLVFVPQSLEGMGSEDQRLRLLKSARLKVVHRYEDPEPLIALAGRKLVPDFSFALAEDVGEEEDRVRWVERWRVAPEEILGLGVGEAMVFREGVASKVAVEASPRLEPLALPKAEPIDRVYEWQRVEQEAKPPDEGEPESDEVEVEAEDEEAEGDGDEDEAVVAQKEFVFDLKTKSGGSEGGDDGEVGHSSGSPSSVFSEEE